jgi:hypothetical protein
MVLQQAELKPWLSSLEWTALQQAVIVVLEIVIEIGTNVEKGYGADHVASFWKEAGRSCRTTAIRDRNRVNTGECKMISNKRHQVSLIGALIEILAVYSGTEIEKYGQRMAE